MRRSHSFRKNIACILAWVIFSLQFAWLPAAHADAESSNTPLQLRTSTSNQAGVLTPGAKEAAELLGILPDVEKLMALNRSGAGGGLGDDELGLKVKILEKIMGGSLEVRMVTGRIDRDLTWAYSGQGMLQAKRQRILNYLFTANFMQGGTLGVLSGPAFLHEMPKLGTEFLLLASAIGLGLSTISLYEMKSGHKKVDGDPTILGSVFQLSSAPEPLHRPDLVIKFMRSVPPGATDGKTRVETLIANWKRTHRLRSMQEKNLERLSAINPDGKHYKEDIRLLGDRIRMLFDTRYTVEALDGELLDLLRATELN